MLTLIAIGLALVLAWYAWRYHTLRRRLTLLADAMACGRALLHDTDALPDIDPAWRHLVSVSDALVRELAGLKSQGAGQLSQLETTLGSLREGVLIVDRDNYIVLANPAMHRIFPATHPVVGQRLEVVLHSGEFVELVQRVRDSRESAQREIEFREPGRSIWVEATGAVLRGVEENSSPWCLFVLHDITRQKVLENVRKEFVANVSHEIKTPLAMLKGYADTLAEDDGSLAPAQRLDFVRVIQRHADRLAAIVDDLLTLSRLESGGAILQGSWQEVFPLVVGAVDEFRASYQASGHHLMVSRPETSLMAQVDPLRIGQVLTNLLENAQKYTPAGSQVEVGVRPMKDGGEVEVWVKDNGPGIPAVDLPRVFERFYRVEKGRSRDKGGTGLGLSIVKHIVQLHGGQVSVESRVGQGTRISFRLPARRGEPRREVQAVAEEARRADVVP